MDDLTKEHYDAIVIGSGPGGATIARDLSRQGKHVLVLERGHGDPIQGTIRQSIGYSLIPGKSLLFTPQFLSLFRTITAGGSSINFYATAFEPPYEMFDSHGVDLRPFVKQVIDELPVAPLSDDLIGPAAKRISASALELGYPWQKLPKIVHQELCRPNCDKCTMGCPYGAKWTAREFLDEACTQGAVLLTRIQVLKLEVEKNRVKNVFARRNGQQIKISAPLVILSAGGIGTPLILRDSGIPNAGDRFFFDPLMVVNGVLDDLQDGREFPMVAGFQDKSEGFVLTDLVWPRWVYTIFTAEVLAMAHLNKHSRTLPIMIKVKDDLGGHLTRRGGVHKRLSKTDRQRFGRGREIANDILTHAGAHHIFSTWYTAVHPGGTAKIGETVDSNLKTELDNLFVCDCSVIPESWGLPPVTAILALGTRLGKHLQSWN